MQGGHDLLVALWRGLTRAEQPLPAAAMKALGLLHSYLLLRPLTALGEHEVSLLARDDAGPGQTWRALLYQNQGCTAAGASRVQVADDQLQHV